MGGNPWVLKPLSWYLYADTTETKITSLRLTHVTLMHKTAPNCTWTAFNSCTVTCNSLTTRQGYSKCLLINCPCPSFCLQGILTRGMKYDSLKIFWSKKLLLVPIPSQSDLRWNFRQQMIKTFLANDYFDELQHATTAFNWMLAEKKQFLSKS